RSTQHGKLMSPATQDDLGKLILRLTIGVLLLFHGMEKMSNGISGIENLVVGRGLPGFIAWGAYIGEVVAPLLLIVGVYARLGAMLVVVNMLAAILLVHMGHLTQFSSSGGWRLELQGFFLFGALAAAFFGAGR